MKTYSAHPDVLALADQAAALLWPGERVSVVRALPRCRVEVIVDGEPRVFTGLLAVQIGNAMREVRT